MHFTTLKKTAARFLLSLWVILLVSVMASAYTIVMRGGKRVEIPAQFTVTATTLSYQVASGINVMLQMAAIDVPATERANNEPTGSFLRRAQTVNGSNQVPSVRSQTTPARTITNQDLERYERARLESEKAYEKRRQELGLPSLEESRRRAEREEAALDEIIAKRRQQESENYWREREAALQAEIATANARMNALESESSWSDGFIAVGGGTFAPNSRLRFGFQRRFPFGFNQGSPCGFNPSPSCLLSHPFPLGFNQGFFSARRSVLVAPGANVGGRHFGGRIVVGPGRR